MRFYGMACTNEDAGRFTIPPPYYDADAYLSTIDRLAALNLEHLFPWE